MKSNFVRLFGIEKRAFSAGRFAAVANGFVVSAKANGKSTAKSCSRIKERNYELHDAHTRELC